MSMSWNDSWRLLQPTTSLLSSLKDLEGGMPGEFFSSNEVAWAMSHHFQSHH